MAVIAFYNSKGGVGKTVLSVNLAWQAAQNGHRVLLWEIDSQGDSSWLVRCDGPNQSCAATEFLISSRNVKRQIQSSRFDRLHILSADTNIRNTENFLVAFSRQQRFSRLLSELEEDYDLIIFDCPPGFTEANQKILLNAHIVVAPLVPSPLAFRSLQKIQDFMTRKRGAHSPILPVFNMVDRRRRFHQAALQNHPEWPVVYMSSEIDRMTELRSPVGQFAPQSSSARIFGQLWGGISAKLRRMHVIRNICQQAA